MNRALQYFNLLGVAALALLCVFQWRANRQANLARILAETDRLAEEARVGDQTRALKETAADLEGFRGQLARAKAGWNQSATNLEAARLRVAQLAAERDQLKISTTNWAAAVSARDGELAQARSELEKLARDRDENALQYNSLAAKYNDLVKDLAGARSEAARWAKQVSTERAGFNQSSSNWVAAVSARDDRLKRLDAELEKTAGERNEAVEKYNRLATQYNALAKDLKDARSKPAPSATNFALPPR